MIMTPALRKFALTSHVSASVGWLGAVAGFLALAIAGLTSLDAERAGAAYLAMEVTSRFVIVPLSFASLGTGLVSSLGTKWGLLRHYWVVAKLFLTVASTAFLLLHTRPIRLLAHAAGEAAWSSTDLRPARIQLAADAGAALLVLLVNTTLGVYKPRGLTRYGWGKERERRVAPER
jgi:hypothetical protein